jgi:hypothetical protein
MIIIINLIITIISTKGNLLSQDKKKLNLHKEENKENINKVLTTNLETYANNRNIENVKNMDLNVNVRTNISTYAIPPQPSPLIGLKDRMKNKNKSSISQQQNKNVQGKFLENKQNMIDKFENKGYDKSLQNVTEKISENKYDNISVQQQNEKIELKKNLNKNETIRIPDTSKPHQVINLKENEVRISQGAQNNMSTSFLRHSGCVLRSSVDGIIIYCLYIYMYIYTYMNMWIYMYVYSHMSASFLRHSGCILRSSVEFNGNTYQCLFIYIHIYACIWV